MQILLRQICNPQTRLRISRCIEAKHIAQARQRSIVKEAATPRDVAERRRAEHAAVLGMRCEIGAQRADLRFGISPLPGISSRDAALVAAGGVKMGDLTNALDFSGH